MLTLATLRRTTSLFPTQYEATTTDDRCTIDDATAADVADVATLMRRVRTEALPYLSPLHGPADDHRSVARLIAETTVRVARSDRIVGFCARRPGWIDQLYIDSDERARGIGSRLLGETLVGAAVRLWTFQRNEVARIFYARRGFVEVERTDGRRNEEREPDVLMISKPSLCP